MAPGGDCATCGVRCPEKADDGNYYCDICWSTWLEAQKPTRSGPGLPQSGGGGGAGQFGTQQWTRPWYPPTQQVELAKQEAEAEQRREREKAKLEAKRQAELKELEARKSAYWEERNKQPELVEAESKAEEPAKERTPVVFWGICDLKYDPRLPEKDRVKVLELGDGRSSRFSHDGAVIKNRFDRLYKMDETPLRRQVMVDNKRFTHDTFLQCGFAFLRPRQFSYPRLYNSTLAETIKKDLDLSMEDSVVLKLINRARGAGVVVCPVSHLNSTLRRLLVPPTGSDLSEFLKKRMARSIGEEDTGDLLAEHASHFWSNESPIFVVEQLCRSMPVSMATGASNASTSATSTSSTESGDDPPVFDGTMRVAYALRKRPREEGKLDIEWLGGYWKLPPRPLQTGMPASSNSLDEVHTSLVSSFNTEEKRTSVVEREHLLEVYTALSPALPRIFELNNMGLRELTFSYPQEPMFRAFALTRCAAAMRHSSDLPKSTHVLDQARRNVPMPDAPGCWPELSVLSYIDRTTGVNWSMRGYWVRAAEMFEAALSKLPTNATAHYLRGIVYQEQQKWQEALDCHSKAVALDPDFRSPLMALGEVYARFHRFKEAVDVSEVCLYRQPDAPFAQFYIGQALYHQLRNGVASTQEEAERMREKGLQAFRIAKRGIGDKWTEAADKLLQDFENHVDKELPYHEILGWKNYGWRP